MGGAQPRAGLDRSARQRSEQYLTSAQSRTHFLRQTKGRRQTTQSLAGRSVLRRIRAIRSPTHWLAAPVEEPLVSVRRELIDNTERCRAAALGGCTSKPVAAKGADSACGDCARMQGDANSIWRSTGSPVRATSYRWMVEVHRGVLSNNRPLALNGNPGNYFLEIGRAHV